MCIPGWITTSVLLVISAKGEHTLLSQLVYSQEMTTAMSPPGPPTDVIAVSDDDNIGIQWEPPTNAYGMIRKYIVSYAILPSSMEKTNIVGGDVTMTIIPVINYRGLLFRIRIQAENSWGIGDFSAPKYVRIECGGKFYISPGENLTVTLPESTSRSSLQSGLLCIWSFRTIPKYSIDIIIAAMKLNIPSYKTCQDTFVDVSGIGRRCHSNMTGNIMRTNLNAVKVKFKTGLIADGAGFKLSVVTAILLPSPPSQITLRVSDHAVHVAWQPPISDTLNITAYHIRYGLISHSHIVLVTVSHNMRHFAINTDTYEGKLMSLTLTAVIGLEEGESSRSYYIRTPCRRRINISDFDIVNVSSPGYPHSYPSNIICTWIVTSQPEVTLSITYLDFRIEDTSYCNSDYITFSFQPEHFPECSGMDVDLPRTMTTRSNNFTLTFVTDGRTERPGFLIQIRANSPRTSTTSSSNMFTDHDNKQPMSQTTWLPSTRVPMTSLTALLPSTKISPSSDPARLTSPYKPINIYNNLTNVSTTTLQSNFQRTSSTPLTPSLFVVTTSTLPGEVTNTGMRADTNRYNTTYAHVGNEVQQEGDNKPAVRVDAANVNRNGNIIVVCMALLGSVLVLAFMVVCVKRRRQIRKIHPTSRYDAPNIELHDIIPHVTDSSSTSCRMHSSIDKPRNITQFINERKLDAIPEVCELDGIPNNEIMPRGRCHSFPFSFPRRKHKLYRDIHRSLKLLNFIEDKKSLERLLKRKHGLIRTNSF